MSVSILDEIVAELHTKHGEEAGHLLPDYRVRITCLAVCMLTMSCHAWKPA